MVYYNMFKESREFKKTTEEEYNDIWDRYALLRAYIDLYYEVGSEAYNLAVKDLYNLVYIEVGYIPIKLYNDNEVNEILEAVNKIESINRIK